MKSVIHFLRYLTGVFFIFSGVVKAIDPIGTGIKLEEYFTVFTEYLPALTPLWEFCAHHSLGLSIFTIVLEMILGVSLLLGTFFNLTMLLLFGLMLFFTILTGFTLATGKVTDCGCFGDFMKLEPIETFMKDVIITGIIVIIWIFRSKLTKMKGTPLNIFFGLVVLITLLLLFTTSYGIVGKMVIVLVMAISALLYGFINSVGIKPSLAFISFCLLSLFLTGFTFRNVWNLPIVDFRAYKIGTDLADCTSTEGLDMGETISKFVMEKNGEQKTVDLAEYSALLKEGWKYRDRIDKVIREPEEPKCKDFKVLDEHDEEMQDVLILDAKGTTLIISSYDVDKGCEQGFNDVAELAKEAKSKGYNVIGLTGSLLENAQPKAKSQYKYYSLDAVPIKTMNRSNPGLTVVKDGIVVGKYHHNHLPSVDNLIQK